MRFQYCETKKMIFEKQKNLKLCISFVMVKKTHLIKKHFH